MKEIDILIQKELFKKYGDNLERRDEDYLVDKGGILFLVDVDYSHYIDINLYKNGLVQMTFRKDDYKLISLVVDKVDEVEDFLQAFLSLVDENQLLKSRFDSLSHGEIPKDLIRNGKISKILI
jgi:hypothetical protein